jgi:hypothetical protein
MLLTVQSTMRGVQSISRPSKTSSLRLPPQEATLTGHDGRRCSCPYGLIDCARAAGIRGTPFIVAAWMVGAMATFAFYLHTTATHEIRFTGPDTAVGSIHVFNATG